MISFRIFESITHLFSRTMYSASIFLCIVCTIYDLRMKKLAKEPKKLFILFSLYTNGQKLFEMTSPKNSFNSFHGIRSLAAFSIMLYHRYSSDYGAYDYLFKGAFLRYSLRMSVDTFFVISAFLQTISLLKAIDEKRLKIWKVILRRYLRYTPVLMGSVFLIMILPHFVGERFNNKALTCSNDFKENWFTFFLQINNYFMLYLW